MLTKRDLILILSISIIGGIVANLLWQRDIAKGTEPFKKESVNAAGN